MGLSDCSNGLTLYIRMWNLECKKGIATPSLYLCKENVHGVLEFYFGAIID